MKVLIATLFCALSIQAFAQKPDYVGVYKDIMASGAENFKGFVGEKFLENDKGIYYKASINQVDADTVYFANLKLVGELGYYAVYHNYNLKQIEVQKQMNEFMNDYNYQGLAKVSLLPQGKVDYMLMTNIKNGKWMAALVSDHDKNELQVWVFAGWYEDKK
ncbi:hypothetical protein [Pedobacter foliorum]|uniref:hypothetical protein n=1 Tax=Pedobacter foliorum TaxID=2739058 RepID=UPI0015669CA3|nr:hypothetical protein [Pedobacter foliorum]NRF40878.1 hypothetical protein [Pedobacter foliorum]